MSKTATRDVEPPETVIIFGGNAKHYHEPAPWGDDLRTRCSIAGRNPMEKERELIESHYQPCSVCFPNHAAQQEDDS